MFFLNFKKKQNCAFQKAFSLVELIIVVAIFLIISAIILSKQSKFSSDILITNVAYQIALSIREAQVYGIGSKQRLDSGNFIKLGYGVSIKAGSNLADKTVSYDFFADKTDSGVIYQYDDGDTVLETATLPAGQKIRNICGKTTSSGWSCWEIGGAVSAFNLNIVFVRPNPEPHIENGSSVYTQALIVVESAIGDKCRVIRVTSTGQISVDPLDPADSTNGCGTTS